MIGASSSIAALKASLSQSVDVRLTRLKKTIVAVEEKQVKNTDQLGRALKKVLMSIKRVPDVTPEQLQLVADYRSRVGKFDLRKTETESKAESKTEALFAACTDDALSISMAPSSSTGDEWDKVPPLSNEEAFRLVDIERAYSTYVSGQFILKPGADTKAMIEAAIDGRPFTVATLMKLHSHLEGSFTSGGIALASGPLFSELTRILRAQGALPPPSEKTYGELILEELIARS
jgi:hypothetical protein